MILNKVAPLDDLLALHAEAIGRDLPGYRNHAYRVLNFCLALSTESPDRIAKIATAVAFHDLGIWTHHTFDYLPPSDVLVRDWLHQHGDPTWCDEVSAMIQLHHKFTPCAADAGPLAEAFRRADWVDVTHGVIAHGLPRALLREVFAAFPDAGFHLLLLKLSFKRVLSHPLHPLPMMRW
ncbi:MAG: hypothetical protein ACEQSK_14815 [Sphingomonadaceae bacterium]